MMTDIELWANAETIANVLRLIEKYRRIENATLTSGFAFIKEISRPGLEKHLCGHWKGKNKSFGSFYLNLDHKLQFSILNFWAITHSLDEQYINRVEEDPRAMLFERPTGFLSVAQKLLLFFENHGINPDPAGDGSVDLRVIPKAKRFGNSANWGDYIISLPLSERVRVLSEILNRA
jgi:hypothetical protein